MAFEALARPFLSFPFFLFMLAIASNVFVAAQQFANSECADVHLFLARGNGEEYPGRIGDIVPATCNGLDSDMTCDYEDIRFTSVAGSVYCEYSSSRLVLSVCLFVCTRRSTIC